MDDLAAIIGDHQTFLASIFDKVAAAGFDLDDFIQCDHLCYRTTSLAQYEEKKQALASVADQIGETTVNQRPIATFRLHQPLHYKKWRIDVLEVPAPKPGVETREGLDHVEFVIYDDKETFLRKYADKDFVMVSADRGINPEIAYRLGDGLTVKFHLLNLATVVYLEQKLGINEVAS